MGITIEVGEDDWKRLEKSIVDTEKGIIEIRGNNKATAQTIGYLCSEVDTIRSDLRLIQEKGTLHTAAVLPLTQKEIADIKKEVADLKDKEIGTLKDEIKTLKNDYRTLLWKMVGITIASAVSSGIISFIIGHFVV